MTVPTFSIFTCHDPVAARLDAYVRSHPQGSPYHLNAWRLAVETAYGYPGLALVAHAEDGRIAGLLPLCEVKVPMRGCSWVSLPYCDLGGPLADSAEMAAALADRARAAMRARGIASMDLRCTMQPGEEEQALAGRKVRMLLELGRSAQEMMAAYPPKLRSQIRKAEKNGLSFEVAAAPGAVDDFYEVYARNMHRLGSPAHSRRWFAAIEAGYAASGDVTIGLVRHAGQVIGAGLVLHAGQRAAIPWASTVAEFNHLAPNMLLYWGLQAHLAEHGVSSFDFGRSTMGEGTYRFKRQWGAAPCALDWQRWTSAGRQEDQSVAPGVPGSRIRPMIESVWKQLPLSLVSAVGPRVRKFITL